MNKQTIIELKQKLNEYETKVSNQQTKVADKKRNVLIAYILIVLGIIATAASGGVGILLFILIIPYLIWTLNSRNKSKKELFEMQDQMVKLKNDLIAIENS